MPFIVPLYVEQAKYELLIHMHCVTISNSEIEILLSFAINQKPYMVRSLRTLSVSGCAGHWLLRSDKPEGNLDSGPKCVVKE